MILVRAAPMDTNRQNRRKEVYFALTTSFSFTEANGRLTSTGTVLPSYFYRFKQRRRDSRILNRFPFVLLTVKAFSPLLSTTASKTHPTSETVYGAAYLFDR